MRGWGRVAGGEGSWRVVGLEKSCMGREGGEGSWTGG